MANRITSLQVMGTPGSPYRFVAIPILRVLNFTLPMTFQMLFTRRMTFKVSFVEPMTTQMPFTLEL